MSWAADRSAWILAALGLGWLFRAKLREAWVQGVVGQAIGWPYWWGRGDPSTSWAEAAQGVDCSGFAQIALVKLGYLDSGEQDRASASLRDISEPLTFGEQVPGDLAFWPGHVEVVWSLPGEDGDSWTIGASGGDDQTAGDDSSAQVQLRTGATTRSGFQGFYRLRR